MFVPLDHLPRKPLQRVLVGNIAHEVLTLLTVYHANMRSSLTELLGDAPPDTLCATCNDGYFILEIHHLSYIRIIFATLLASLFQPCIRLAHQEMATVVGNLDLCTLLEQHDDV